MKTLSCWLLILLGSIAAHPLAAQAPETPRHQLYLGTAAYLWPDWDYSLAATRGSLSMGYRHHLTSRWAAAAQMSVAGGSYPGNLETALAPLDCDVLLRSSHIHLDAQAQLRYSVLQAGRHDLALSMALAYGYLSHEQYRSCILSQSAGGEGRWAFGGVLGATYHFLLSHHWALETYASCNRYGGTYPVWFNTGFRVLYGW